MEQRFSDVKPVPPSAWLTSVLAKTYKLGKMIGTEKSRSEMIVAPILVAVRAHFDEKISLFSGRAFNVDAKLGLSGTCDFLLSRSPNQKILEAPIIAITEAKKGDLDEGLGQCTAEMVAARIFNQRRGKPIDTIYGVVTTGEYWQFLKLESSIAYQDANIYGLTDLPKILGILHSFVGN